MLTLFLTREPIEIRSGIYILIIYLLHKLLTSYSCCSGLLIQMLYSDNNSLSQEFPIKAFLATSDYHKLLWQPEKRSVKKFSFSSLKRNPLLVLCYIFSFYFFRQRVKQGWLDGQTSTPLRTLTTLTTLTTFFISARHLVPSPGYAQLCVVWDQRDRQAEGKGCETENEGKETGENVPCRHCVFGSSRRCLSQWLLQRLLMVVEWSRSGVAGYGMVWYGVLWWWKLCVFLCHIPIYINLVFAMTDDICQCQTFSFSISASPASPAALVQPARTCESWFRSRP